MLKPFTAEGRFECGFNEITPGKRCALFAVRQEHGIGLGLAVAEEPGYHTIPLHWCNGDDFEQMSAHADDLNRELFGLEPKAAGLIVASTMRPLARREHPKDPPCDPATDWTRTVYLEAYATESGDGPAYARLEVRLSFIDLVQALRELCKEAGLTQARIYCGPDQWGPGTIEEELRLTAPELVVTPTMFWFEDVPKHQPFRIETACQDIDHFVEVVSGPGEPLYIGIDREDVAEQNAAEP